VTRVSSVAIALTMLLASSPGHPTTNAQSPAQPVASGSPSSRTSPDSPRRTVRLDAIVVDKQGRPIADLTPADVAVTENGVTQKVDTIQIARRSPPPVGPVNEPGPVNGPDDEERAAREPGTRVIGLYLDEFHVQSGASTDRVRHAVARFIDEQLRPGDLVIVMKPLDPLTSIRFTRDRDVARRAVENFSGRKEDYAPRTTFEEQYLGRSPSAVIAARAQIVLSGVRALTTRIGELDAGLSALVLVTEGFTSELPRSRERRLPDLQGLTRVASRSRTLLYAFDPADQPHVVDPADAADPDGGVTPLEALQAVARQTGGDVVRAGEDLAPAFQRVSRDLDSYYVVTFTPASAADGRFHAIQLTSTRKDAQIRTRSGYWAPFPPETRTTRASTAPIVPMRMVRRSLLIDSWLGVMMEPDGRRRIIFTWTPAGTPAKPQKPVSRPDVVTLKVTTLSGAVLFDGDVAPARGFGVTGQRSDSATFKADPGRLQLDLTISKADGTKLDVGSQDFDVPEIRAGRPFIFPVQLFRTASARELREISADANAAPMPGREFRRTETLLLRVPTYDLSGGQVTVSAKLINRVGAMLTELKAMPFENSTTLSQFDLPLARFAPGEYSIEIAAQSPSGTSRELIRLRITG
jgi:VWFA-related protein